MLSDPVSARAGHVAKEKLPDVMTVRFREGAFERIDALAGPNKRAEFIRKVVEAEVIRQERAKAKKLR